MSDLQPCGAGSPPAPVTALDIRLRQEAHAERYARALLMPELAFLEKIDSGAGATDIAISFSVSTHDVSERAEDLGCTFSIRTVPQRRDRAHLLPELPFLQSMLAGATAAEIAHTQSLDIEDVKARASDLGLTLP